MIRDVLVPSDFRCTADISVSTLMTKDITGQTLTSNERFKIKETVYLYLSMRRQLRGYNRRLFYWSANGRRTSVISQRTTTKGLGVFALTREMYFVIIWSSLSLYSLANSENIFFLAQEFVI